MWLCGPCTRRQRQILSCGPARQKRARAAQRTHLQVPLDLLLAREAVHAVARAAQPKAFVVHAPHADLRRVDVRSERVDAAEVEDEELLDVGDELVAQGNVLLGVRAG